MTVEFKVERETKNTIRFAEEVAPGNDPKIGVIYIPKGTLAEVKWVDGDRIGLSLTVVKD